MLAHEPVLDLACGKGRYAIQLNKLGLAVEGIDLSKNSIVAAKPFENEKLHFAVHDMRCVYKPNHFGAVLNLFTSFGYFDDDRDNQKAMNAFATNLKPDGILVIDFMNTPKVIAHLVAEEMKTVSNITFDIRRKVAQGFIVKEIKFEAEGEQHAYQERVKVILLQDFMRYFAAAGLELREIYGDYTLAPYHAAQSERMIFVLGKK